MISDYCVYVENHIHPEVCNNIIDLFKSQIGDKLKYQSENYQALKELINEGTIRDSIKTYKVFIKNGMHTIKQIHPISMFYIIGLIFSPISYI